MKIEFVATPLAASTSPVAYLVAQDKLPGSLDPVFAQGAKSSRFTGKTGQLYESFVSRDGAVVRIALAGDHNLFRLQHVWRFLFNADGRFAGVDRRRAKRLDSYE